MEFTRVIQINRTVRFALTVVIGMLWFASCGAQESAATPSPSGANGREIPRPDQLEPGVNTTATAPAAQPPAAAPPAAAAVNAPASGAAAASGPAAGAPAAAAGTADAASASTAPRAAADAGKGAAATKAAARKGPDRLELDATDITGNRELPKVLYIVPWKRSDLGDVVGRPVNSLLDEVLQPLDRDVFQRENRYYDGLKSGAGAPKAGAAQGSESKP